MKICNVKKGDVLKIGNEFPKDKEIFFDDKWKVIKVFRNHVLARSMKIPQIRRSFCIGDLVMMGLEGKEMIAKFATYDEL